MNKAKKAKTYKVAKRKIDPSKLKELYLAGMKNKDLATYFNVTTGAITQAVSRYCTNLDRAFNIDSFEASKIKLIAQLQQNIIHLLNINKLKSASAGSLVSMLAILIDKQRLLQGKSTENVGVAAIHSLHADDRQLLKDTIKKITRRKLEQSRKEYKKLLDK